MSIAHWQARIDAEQAQSARLRGAPRPADGWTMHAQAFRADPRRVDDPLVNRLSQEVAPHQTLIDVGAGGGRLALPLALRCQRVIAVEPSPSMVAVLRQQLSDFNIANVTVAASRWEDAEVEPADLVLCVHMLYTIRNIAPFVRKLESHARERVLAVLFRDAPQARLHPLWERLHGEPRQPLPSLAEFQAVLRELGIEAQTEALPPQPPRGFDSPADALRQLSRRLYTRSDDAKMQQLEQLLPENLEERDSVFQLRGAGDIDSALVWWRPMQGE